MDRFWKKLSAEKKLPSGKGLPFGKILNKSNPLARNSLLNLPPQSLEEPSSTLISPLSNKKNRPPIYCREDRINTLKIKQWILTRKNIHHRAEGNLFQKKVMVHKETENSNENVSDTSPNKLPSKRSSATIRLIQGFTLIELLIVVAIAGILSAIALPMYQDYVARSQLLEAVTVGGAYKLTIEDHIQNIGAFPDQDALATIFGELADDAGDGTLVGFKTIQQITLTPAGGNSTGGVFELTLADVDGIKTPLRGSTVTFTRADSGAWTCESSLTEQDLVPKGCEISS